MTPEELELRTQERNAFPLMQISDGIATIVPEHGKYQELIEATTEMRDIQKKYFAAPYGKEKNELLSKSKVAEQRVDKILLEITGKQRSLYE